MKNLKGKKVQVNFNHHNHSLRGFVNDTNKQGLFISVLTKEYGGFLEEPQNVFIPFNSIHFMQFYKEDQ